MIGVFPKFNSPPPQNISNNNSNLDLDDIGNQYLIEKKCSYETAQFTEYDYRPLDEPFDRFCIIGNKFLVFSKEYGYKRGGVLNQKIKKVLLGFIQVLIL